MFLKEFEHRFVLIPYFLQLQCFAIWRLLIHRLDRKHWGRWYNGWIKRRWFHFGWTWWNWITASLPSIKQNKVLLRLPLCLKTIISLRNLFEKEILSNKYSSLIVASWLLPTVQRDSSHSLLTQKCFWLVTILDSVLRVVVVKWEAFFVATWEHSLMIVCLPDQLEEEQWIMKVRGLMLIMIIFRRTRLNTSI